MLKRILVISYILISLQVAALQDHTASSHHAKRTTPQDCVAGQYFEASSSSCQSCPAGSYTKESRQTSCMLARTGYYIPNSGATSEMQCSAGSYTSSRGATECAPCPAGYKCPSSACQTPQKCSPGTFTSTTGNTSCQNCRPGTFNSVEGATDCCSCCAGWLNDNSGLVNCRQCPHQTPYSSPGSSSTSACSSTLGMYAPVSSCSQTGRFCPQTYANGPSNMVRRELKPRECAQPGYKACPVYKRGAKLTPSGIECVNVQNDLWSCGGCTSVTTENGYSEDGGRDCSSIPNVGTVSCRGGDCVIESCKPRYGLSADRTRCVSLLSVHRHAHARMAKRVLGHIAVAAAEF
ncbi:hypothetical protein HGRIS_008886 [Hohenbuehelia grisea]|uniref:Tyrosine-protein kinase ephrin type A/B receptor-like domain-containing protein n=1 Tax=Hohenbuehelia grisea TaxID=104357 RepID=A0ABR3IZF4_9AGAR